MSAKRRRPGTGLINKTRVRAHILDRFRATRPLVGVSRIDVSTFAGLEARLEQIIAHLVETHPSGFKTFAPYAPAPGGSS